MGVVKGVLRFVGATVVQLVLIMGAWTAVSLAMHSPGPSWGQVALGFVGLVFVGLSKVAGGKVLARRRHAEA